MVCRNPASHNDAPREALQAATGDSLRGANLMTAVAVRQLTYAEAINEAISVAMREDPRVILLGEDVAGGANIDHLAQDEAWGGVLGVTKGLVKEFGRSRILDTPITEAGFIGAAVGAA